MKKQFLMAVMALFLTSSVALAGDPKPVGTFGDWAAYSYVADDGGKVCFMSSAPEKSSANKKNVNRGEIFLFITHWPKDGTKNVVSVNVGYPLKKDSAIDVAVNGKSYDLFTQGETGWTQDQSTDNALTENIRKGSSVVVKAMSQRGTKTTDTYSLKGSGDAYDAITKECGI